MPRVNREKIVNDIKAYFINKPAVSTVYLFGSTAKGLSRENSDIDIALLFEVGLSPSDRFEQKLEIASELEDILHHKIDIVDLESADLFLIHQVMIHKVLLLERDLNRRVFFEVEKRREYFDRQPFYLLHHREALKRLSNQRRELRHG